jgi:hypothetical protein
MRAVAPTQTIGSDLCAKVPGRPEREQDLHRAGGLRGGRTALFGHEGTTAAK